MSRRDGDSSEMRFVMIDLADSLISGDQALGRRGDRHTLGIAAADHEVRRHPERIAMSLIG
jgi:hypothetical protein